MFFIKYSLKILEVIWDYLFIEGPVALLKAGLVLLQMIENKILKMKNFGSFE